MRRDIVLIGPIRAGKSTQGRLLAEALNLQNVSADEHVWRYYRELAPGGEVERAADGMISSRFQLYAIERLLADYHDCVIDMGAGHTVFREPEALAVMARLLGPYSNVVLLLPCADLDASSRVLHERNRDNPWLIGFTAKAGYNPNEHFLRHPSNFRLAKHIVYTNGRTPEQTRDEILALSTIAGAQELPDWPQKRADR